MDNTNLMEEQERVKKLLLHVPYRLRTLVIITAIFIMFVDTIKSIFAFTPFSYLKFFNHEVFLRSPGLHLPTIFPGMIFCNSLFGAPYYMSEIFSFLFLMLIIISVVLLRHSNITEFRLLSSIVPQASRRFRSLSFTVQASTVR